MTDKRSIEVPSPSQIESFKEAARQLSCDEDEKTFDEKLKGIAKKEPRRSKTKNRD